MKSLEDAQALCQRERDPFYLDALNIGAWLGNVIWEAAAEYAEKKQAQDRAMQTGQAWRAFLELFGHVQDTKLPQALKSLHRLAEYEEVHAGILRQAAIPLSLELECFSDPLAPKTPVPLLRPPEAPALIRHTIQRWCDWLDAVVHFSTHALSHLHPAAFDPDPQKRELAALGLNQRNFARLDDFMKAFWQWHHGQAAERFKQSPKWSTVGNAMASANQRVWNYPDLDRAVILIWPLLKRQSWTYWDLLAVVRTILPSHHRYPLETETELATYCQNVLGLRKSGPKGRSSPGGKPPGWDVAVKLCARAPSSS